MDCDKKAYFSENDDISSITVPSCVIDDCIRHLDRDGNLRAVTEVT